MKKIYDILGIGIGPFNLGLASIVADIPELDCLFIDQNESFDWHPGMMIEGARLQVPFYADLVTPVNPKSRFTYLNFLKESEKLFRFAIQEQNFPLRMEYNQYLQWVAAQLPSLRFGFRAQSLHYNSAVGTYMLVSRETKSGKEEIIYAKHIIIGVGTEPYIPSFVPDYPNICHSSKYMDSRNEVLNQKGVTIIGSGQSAAEIFYDLLQWPGEIETINWFTRSAQFFPMDYSKFTLEMTSPDYIDYFYNLDNDQKKATLQKQGHLFKGINQSLIAAIHELLHLKSLRGTPVKINLRANTALTKVESEESLRLTLDHLTTQKSFTISTDFLILATGYHYVVPKFLEPVKEQINWTDTSVYTCNRNYAIDNGHKIFVQNADFHSHGFNSADLGMGPYRNATILNSILQREHFSLEKNNAFQKF